MKKLLRVVIFFYLLLFFTPYISSISSTTPSYKILIDLNELTLSLMDSKTNKRIKCYPISAGALDSPSPIGTWQIKSKAIMKGPYGGYWIGLNVPWDTFGIHGTSNPSSIGTLASGGCIRMYNYQIKELFNLVQYDTLVIITSGPNLSFSPYQRTIKPGDRGSDVYYIQQRLHDLGYFKGTINGIYEYTLEIPVLRYKRDFDIIGKSEINQDFLDSIGLFKFE